MSKRISLPERFQDFLRSHTLLRNYVRPLLINTTREVESWFRSDRLEKLQLPGFEHPFYVRTGTSDPLVVRQVFGNEEYIPLSQLQKVSLIIDCGANIGCSSVYFLSKYPNAFVIAIEPDAGNFELCQKNLAPFRARSRVLQAGIWPEQVSLRVVRGKFGDGREWACQVEPCSPNEKLSMPAVTISQVLQESGFDSIDILKIDIERTELALFSKNYDWWLSRTKNIAIELHGQDCEDVYFHALSQFDYQLEKSGELTICKGLSRKSTAD